MEAIPNAAAMPNYKLDGTIVEEDKSPKIFWKIVFGVFCGNLLTAIVAGILYSALR